ncbi:MAG: single-stranded DNA-binding protein [Clostridia bacterium]
MENFNENNVVELGGIVVSIPEYSHELFEEKFYKFFIETRRLSAYSDDLPIIVSERLLNIDDIHEGDTLHITGQLRSFNQALDGKSKLVLSIFAKEIQKDEEDYVLTLNDATFIGYICKPPIYRKTPLGREIADVLLAVNRSYKKSDYIPCILWGRNARFCEKIEVGAMVKINGRIQSRKYEKKDSNENIITKVAYEVSVCKFSLNEKEVETVEIDNDIIVD